MTPEQETKLIQLITKTIKARDENSMISSDFINNWCELQDFFESENIAVNESLRAVVSAEEIIDCLIAEYKYWKDADCDASIGAIGAVSNVIAFATVNNHRADWHPKKEEKS